MTEALFGLGGVLLGGIVTAMATVWVHARERRAEAKILACSLRAEMVALLRVVELKGQEKSLEDVLMKNAADDNIHTFSVTAAEDYFSVYHGNVGRLGMLTARQAEKVVEFYTIGKAWLEEMRLGHDVSNKEEAITRAQRNLDLLKYAKQLGQEAIGQLE